MAVMPLHGFFFSLLFIFLPTQLGYHFWPAWAQVLGRRIDYLTPTIYLTDILIGLTLLSWITETVAGRGIRYYGFKSIIHNTKTLIPIFLFVGLNMFFAPSRPVAIYKWIKVLEFGLLGWYIVKTKPALSFIIWHLSFGILYSSLIAIAQFFLQHSIGGPLWWLGERTFSLDTPGIAKFQSCQLSAVNCQLLLRPYATFPHPNVLGGYIAAILPLVIIQFSNNPILKLSNIKKTFYFATLVLGVIALVLTFSRSAIVVGMTGVGVMYYVLWVKKKKFFFPIIPYTISIILLLGLMFTTINSNDESIVVRQQLNAAAVRLWQQSPIIGVGLGNFLVELPKALPSREIYFLQPVHNIYLLVLAETGVIGLAWSLLFIGKGIMGLVLRIREKKKRKLFSIWHLSFGIILFLGLVDHYPLTLQQGQLLLTIFLSLCLLRDT